MITQILQRMTAWWKGLNARERLIIGGGSGVAIILLLYGAIWSPLQSDLTRLRLDTPKARAQLEWMRSQTVRMKQLRDQAPTPLSSASLLSFIDQSAITFDVKQAVKRIEPEGANAVRVTLDGVSFNSLVKWMANLHKQGAVRIENASLDAQNIPGAVNARLLLRVSGS